MDDIDHAQRILKDGVVPEGVMLSARNFLQPCVGLNPSQGICCHASAIDLVLLTATGSSMSLKTSCAATPTCRT